jgi:Tfp pilus assembly protein PilO
MSSTPPKAGLPKRILDQFRSPLKLRLVLGPVILGGWYFLFFSPLSDHMAAIQASIDKEQKRIDMASKLDDARKSLLPFKDRVPANSDINELIQFVMARIRSSPLKLIDLKPEASKHIGPFDSISLSLSIEGTYEQIDEFLAGIHNERRLFRVESLSLAPAVRSNDKKEGSGPFKLQLLLKLAALMEMTSPEKPPS